MYRIILIFLLILLASQACISGDFQGYIPISIERCNIDVTTSASDFRSNNIIWEASSSTPSTVVEPPSD